MMDDDNDDKDDTKRLLAKCDEIKFESNSVIFLQKISQSQREETARPVQPARQRAQLDGVLQQPQDGQEHRAQVDDCISQESQRDCGAVSRARDPNRLEAVVPVERGVYPPDPGGAGRVHHRVLLDGTGILCVGEHHLAAGALAGKFEGVSGLF